MGMQNNFSINIPTQNSQPRENNSPIVPKDKLLKLISDITPTGLDREVVGRLQQFSKKFISDILARASLLAEHKKSNRLEAEDIYHVVYKEFDYVFGDDVQISTKNLAKEEHVDRLGELSRHNK